MDKYSHQPVPPSHSPLMLDVRTQTGHVNRSLVSYFIEVGMKNNIVSHRSRKKKRALGDGEELVAAADGV